MRQWSAQSPSASATNSTVRVAPTGTRTVLSGPLARWRNPPAVGRDDLPGVAVDVDRVVVHRRQVADPDPDTVVVADDERVGAGEGAGVEREQVEVAHHVGAGRLAPGSTYHSWSIERDVAVDRRRGRALRGR